MSLQWQTQKHQQPKILKPAQTLRGRIYLSDCHLEGQGYKVDNGEWFSWQTEILCRLLFAKQNLLCLLLFLAAAGGLGEICCTPMIKTRGSFAVP